MRHTTYDKTAHLATTLVALLFGAAGFAESLDGLGTTVVHITGSDYAYTGPDTVPAGFASVTFTNAGGEPHHVQIARLDDGVTPEQVLQALRQDPGAALALVELVGGVGVLMPGQSQTAVMDLSRPGTYIELCLVPDADGVPHLAHGMTRFFEVTAASGEIVEPDIDADLVVRMVDFGYDLPAEVSAGRQVWEVVNDGPQPHEMALMKVADGYDADDVMTYLQSGGEGGPPPAIPVGGAQVIADGRSNFVELDLTPGLYVALCYVPDPATGRPHLALGMVTTFVVRD